MDVFQGQNLLAFSETFKTDQDCKIYLSKVKWENGYKCTRCSNTSSQLRKDYSRTCNKCSYTASTTADTLFHKVKFPLRTAFFICFEMATSTKSLSASQMGVGYGVTEKTARLFMHKVRESMKSSGNNTPATPSFRVTLQRTLSIEEVRIDESEFLSDNS